MRVLHLFAGAGGSHYAAEILTSLESIGSAEYAVDVEDPAPRYNEWVTAELERKYPGEPNYGDVKKIDGRRFRGKVDVIMGGPPCQDFSVLSAIHARRGGFEGPRGQLITDFFRIVQESEAPVFFMENVSGIAQAQNWTPISKVIDALDMPWTAVMNTAESVGAPHERKRVWVMGVRKGQQNRLKQWTFGFPAESMGEGLKASPAEMAWSKMAVEALGSVRVADYGKRWPALQGRWPARMGDEPHRWEPPRLLPNSAFEGESRSQFGTTHGLTRKQDWGCRMHALGNAWCPPQAAAAWCILAGRHLNRSNMSLSTGRWTTPAAAYHHGVGDPSPATFAERYKKGHLEAQAMFMDDVRTGRLNPAWVAALMGWPLDMGV